MCLSCLLMKSFIHSLHSAAVSLDEVLYLALTLLNSLLKLSLTLQFDSVQFAFLTGVYVEYADGNVTIGSSSESGPHIFRRKMKKEEDKDIIARP